MTLFSGLFGKPKSVPSNDEAVLVHLDGRGLPDHVYEKFDLSDLEERLESAIQSSKAGELDGNETGENETTLFLYGPNAETLFKAIEPVLNAYPLCRNARVVIRRGGPGAPQREIRLAAA